MSDTYTVAYRVTITNHTQGWVMTSTAGLDDDLDNPAVTSVLTAPLRIRWGFLGGVAPGPMEARRLTFGIWARTVADERTLELGDVISGVVDLVGGPVLFRFDGGRVTDAPTDLVAGQPWASRTTVEVADFLADLPSTFPGPNIVGLGGVGVWGNLARWQTRFAQIGEAMARSVGIPVGIATAATMSPSGMLRAQWFEGSARDMVDRLVNSWSPNGITHTLVSRMNAASTAYAAGYVWADPADRPTVAGGGPPVPGPTVDPVTLAKYYVVPATRIESAAVLSPLQFITRAGLLTLKSTPAAAPRRNPSLDAGWCEVPTVRVRRRDHNINTVELAGFNQSTQAYGTPNYAKSAQYATSNPVDVAAKGVIARKVDTDLVFREYATDETILAPLKATVPVQAAVFLSDASTLAANRAYPSLTVSAELMAPDDQAALLPHIVPQHPGDGDGRVLRHVTVWGLDDSLYDPKSAPGGFIVAGELSIEQGRLRYSLSTTPGEPTYASTAPVPITLGEFIAKPFALTYHNPDIDPTIRVGDLDKIGN